MQLYFIAGAYHGTQAEAKAAGKHIGIKFAPETHGVDVPTDKAGLISYLNSQIAADAAGVGVVAKPQPLADIAPVYEPSVNHQPIALSGRAVQAQRNISVEEEIANADFPNAVRLADHAVSRVAEHLREIRETADRQARSATPDLKGLLS